MPMYDLLEYSGNLTMTSGSLWNHCRNEMNCGENENDVNGNMVITTK